MCLTELLGICAESKLPPKTLIDACLGAFERSKDARFLVPAMAGLHRSAALALLPKLLSLDPTGLKAALHRLLMLQPVTGACSLLHFFLRCIAT